MSYEMNNWECGETISAEKLNHMEQGIYDANECCEGGGGGAMVLRIDHVTWETVSEGEEQATIVYDHTWQEVADAIANGTPVYVGDLYDGDFRTGICDFEPHPTDGSLAAKIMTPVVFAVEDSGLWRAFYYALNGWDALATEDGATGYLCSGWRCGGK